MGIQLEKSKKELTKFYQEVFIDYRPRYKLPSEWPHLYVDVFLSFFAMSYTLGHAAAVLAPIALLSCVF